MNALKTLVAALIFFCFSLTGAQEIYFGKNKVQYRNFDWEYIQTDHFDIYFYDDAYDLAKFTAEEIELAYDIVSSQLNYYVGARIPVFIYNSHNDFQQTNITWQEPSEGTQGFTEAFKKRIVVHFMGSYEDYRHLLHHELTHAVIYDLIYGEFFKAVLNPSRLFQLPLWLAEGYAEYSSNGGWAQNADMMVRDATIHGYLRPPGYMGFLAYSEGFALVKYIAENYGVDKISEILKKGKALVTIDKALKSSIGLNSEELYEKFSKEMRKRYWPDIALREEPKDFARQLTKHGKDGSHYNEKPVFSPTGQVLAMFTDRNSYSEIYLISSIDGRQIARLVKGERSADLESLRWYTSGMSFSPAGDSLVFVSKASGEDALNFISIKNKNIYLRKKFGLKSIISPAWSPNGKNVIISALSDSRRDLFIYNLEADSLTAITDDRYDDLDVAWFPDGKRIVFSSDRPHPDDNPDTIPNGFNYGVYNLHLMDVETGQITPLHVGAGQNTEPSVSPDGARIAFVSNRNGIENIYVHYIDSARVQAVTNTITNAKSPTWSPDGNRLAFSTFIKGGYDIYVIKDIVPKGENGTLAATDFVMGKYDRIGDWARETEDMHQASSGDDDEIDPSEHPADPDFPLTESDNLTGWGQSTEEETSEDTTTVAAIEKVDESGTDSTMTEVVVVEDDATGDAGSEEEYIYNAPDEDESVFSSLGELVDEETGSISMIEPVDSLLIDSLDNKLSNGEYRVKRYKTKFTPDFVSGGVQYDSFFGFRGQTFFVFSDYLGDHQIYVATDLVNTIDQSNVQFFYLYNKQRIDFGIGLFHTKNFYIDSNDELFSDRFYGIMGSMSWPRTKFNRIELNTSLNMIDRKYLDRTTDTKKNVRVSIASLSWIHDTVLWGITGPVNGRRYKLTVEGATPIFGSESINYYAAELDYRQYIRLGRPFSLAFRMSGGYSGGSHPKSYFLGGNTNRIGNISVAADVYEVENLYFSTVVTPLRGYDYYDLNGTRYAVTNLELHFPFIDYFLMRYPLRLGFSQVTGALFLDMGAAWREGDGFKGATSDGSRLLDIKSGFGFGARANLGFLLLRYDLAWRTDFNSVAPHTKHYFSLGADF
ncbi:MAG: BamA/TamA family outer membrane protein [FCB group bacterium]|nr:BamA/TamA family outer membrane protein [FCB group bacterium]